jgi:hypothetical protein
MKPNGTKVATALVVLVIVLSALGLLIVFNKSPDLLNSEFRVITTDSMDGEPQTQYDIETIPQYSLVAIHKMNDKLLSRIEVGDVVGHYSSDVKGNVYHRVIDIDYDQNLITTRGDNTHSTDPAIPFNEVTGQVVNVSPLAGEVILYLKDNIILVVAVLIILILMIESVSYVLRLGKEKE